MFWATIRPSSRARFDCIYSFWYNAPTLLSTGAMVEMEYSSISTVAPVYTVKKCSWGWVNLSPETCRADLKRLINVEVVASCWLLTSLNTLLFAAKYCAWYKVLSVSTRLWLVTPGARVRSHASPYGISNDNGIGFFHYFSFPLSLSLRQSAVLILLSRQQGRYETVIR